MIYVCMNYDHLLYFYTHKQRLLLAKQYHYCMNVDLILRASGVC